MSRRQHLERLHSASPVILPSLLLCDFGNLEREVARLQAAGVQALHLDVMDGSFVPNISYGMPIVEALRRLSDMPLDVHLMIEHPEKYLQAFCDAGADVITIHAEAVPDPRPVLAEIHKLNVGAGLAINPLTPLAAVERCLDVCDLLLIMSVQAGFGGQAFNPIALEKLQQARDLTAGKVLLEVDGGINNDTISRCASAGAQLFVVGSAIFKQPDYGLAVRRLRELACSKMEAAKPFL
jgi:ribulose-phosphate 3-epimerase